jgi:ABC-type lipoprotein release transport system permease subunit
MSVVWLLLREVRHRKLNFALGLVAVAAAAALPICVLTLCEAADRETTRLMRNMGFNLLIVPKGLSMTDFWSHDFSRADMPEEYVHRISQSKRLLVQHLVARLQRKTEWHGRQVLLTGLLPEVPMRYLPDKANMGLEIPRGEAYFGSEVARSTGTKRGDTVRIGSRGRSRTLRVAKCLAETGSLDDIRIYAHLRDVQDLLGLPGRISEIQALSCQCQGERLPRIRKDLAAELPDTQVTEFRSIAVARAETRDLMARYAAFLTPAAALVCALWVALLAWGNVRERRAEIGLLRALGVGSGQVGALFMGRAVLLGLIGGALGFLVGTTVALCFRFQLFPLTGGKAEAQWSLLLWAALGAPVLCAVAAYVPTLVAVTQDPARVLTEE